MAKQLYLNNWESTFIANVKDAATSGTPATELDYGILRLNSGASALLVNPTGGDWYTITAFKRSGSLESNVEIMKVTNVDNSVINECRITVQRAQEGTSAQAYVPGDYVALRFTKGGAETMLQFQDSRLAAGDVSNTPAGTIAATTVQAAINELDTGKVAKSGDTMTGPLAQAAGTAALPSYTFSGDTDTGIFSPSAGAVAASINGTERLRLTGGGLTVSGTTVSVGFTGTGTGGAVNHIDDSGTSRWRAGLLGSAGATNWTLYDVVNLRSVLTVNSSNGNINIPTLGARITGDFSNATVANRLMFQTSTTNGGTNVSLIPNGTNTNGSLLIHNGSDPANSGFAQIIGNATEIRVSANAVGTGTFLPMTFHTSGLERMRIDSSGNVLVTGSGGLGYGVGSGGTVTQTGSKTSGVALNKPCGRITLVNTLMGAGAVIGFTLTNSAAAGTDLAVSEVVAGANPANYEVRAIPGGGDVTFLLKNISAGNLSDPVVIQFILLKGVVS